MKNNLSRIEKIRIFLNLWRCGITWILILLSRKQKYIIFYEIDRWNFRSKRQSTRFGNLAYLLSHYPEYRNLLFYRLKEQSIILGALFLLIFRRLESLYICTPKIGKGLLIQHGFSTIIAAKEIGEDCWINQQVTIGYKGSEAPSIGNHVRISAGAIVVGNVKLGDGCVVGAGAVVTKDVPAGVVVGGVPARIIKNVNTYSNIALRRDG